MPASFRKTFGKDSAKTAAFPTLVLEKLNEALPQGTRYHVLENGDVCIGPAENEPITLGGFAPVTTSEMETAIGPDPTPEKVLNYSYNAQKPVRLILAHPGFITVNGVEISANRFMMSAAHEIRLDKGSFVAIPSPFPGPHMIEISGEGAHMELSVRRVPSEIANVEMFESNHEAPLTLKYSICESSDADGKTSAAARFTLSANPDKCASLSDVVDMLSIFEAASKGTCTIAGVMAGVMADRSENGGRRVAGKRELQLLRKALAIEKELDVSFDPRKIILDNESAKVIEELHIGLIKKKPIKTALSDASLQLDDEAYKTFGKTIQNDDSKFAFTFSRPASYNLFGKAIELESINGIFELKAQKIERNADGTYQLIMKNPPGEPGGYISSILLKDEDQLALYCSEPKLNDVMELLQLGKPLTDYMKEENAI